MMFSADDMKYIEMAGKAANKNEYAQHTSETVYAIFIQ